jgi:prepilin-type N-terminal cleavage/methylation domain-containing protein
MLSKMKQHNKEQSGFTIIEVLIVLAIAGLILLIVFLAVPTLQRNTRNSSRKADAGRIATATGSFISNNNGTLPATAADADSIYADAGTPGVLKGLGGVILPVATGQLVANKISVKAVPLGSTGTQPVLTPATGDAVGLIPGGSCTSSNTSGLGTGTVVIGYGSASSTAIIYTVETASPPYNLACIQA